MGTRLLLSRRVVKSIGTFDIEWVQYTLLNDDFASDGFIENKFQLDTIWTWQIWSYGTVREKSKNSLCVD